MSFKNVIFHIPYQKFPLYNYWVFFRYEYIPVIRFVWSKGHRAFAVYLFFAVILYTVCFFVTCFYTFPIFYSCMIHEPLIVLLNKLFLFLKLWF